MNQKQNDFFDENTPSFLQSYGAGKNFLASDDDDALGRKHAEGGSEEQSLLSDQELFADEMFTEPSQKDFQFEEKTSSQPASETAKFPNPSRSSHPSAEGSQDTANHAGEEGSVFSRPGGEEGGVLSKPAGEEGYLPAGKREVIEKLLNNILQNVEQIQKLLSMTGSSNEETSLKTQKSELPVFHHDVLEDEGRVVEGVFDGQNMIGQDGKEYQIKPNYASKSKLIEGDILKLIIHPTRGMIYKQIGPIDRVQLIGTLEYDSLKNMFFAAAEGKRWKILRASVTYYKGEPGDEVVFVIPKRGQAAWAAVENIIKK